MLTKLTYFCGKGRVHKITYDFRIHTSSHSAFFFSTSESRRKKSRNGSSIVVRKAEVGLIFSFAGVLQTDNGIVLRGLRWYSVSVKYESMREED